MIRRSVEGIPVKFRNETPVELINDPLARVSFGKWQSRYRIAVSAAFLTPTEEIYGKK